MTSPEVLIGKAAGHLASGNLKTAANLCRRVLKAAPRHADALHLLGVVTYKAGDPKRAARYLKDALALRGADAEITRNLAFAQRDSGDPDGATESFRKAIGLDPNDLVSHFQIGALLGGQDEHEAAIKHFDFVVKSDPDNGLAHYNRGKAFLALERFPEAHQDFAAASVGKQADYQVFSGWGLALSFLSRFADARAKYRVALTKEPPPEKVSDLGLKMGDAYFSDGLTQEAKAQYEAVRDRDPSAVGALTGLAKVYDRGRDYQRAYELIEPLVGEDIPPAWAAIAFAQVAPRLGERDRAIERLNAAFGRPKLRNKQRRRLHFELGKLLDSVGEFDEAFHHYKSGNELYGVTYYEPSSHTDQTNQKIAEIDREAASSVRRLSSARSDQPVFIVGMPRSGTSLVEQILASHPRIAGGGELMALPDIVSDRTNRFGSLSLWSVLGTDGVASIAKDYVDILKAVDTEATRVTDKLPHNFEHLWLIAAAFPGAPVIHCTRHPLDNCLSCYFQDFGIRHEYSRNLTDLGRHYVDYRRLMDHWRSTLDLNMMDVAYEDVVRDTEKLGRQIVEFCGLDWDPACLQFHENKRVVQTASYDQVRRPIYRQSVGRYRHYERYIGDLKDTLQMAGI